MNTETLAHGLKNSRVTPGVYLPSEAVRNGEHIAIMFNGAASILFGPSDCSKSKDAAKAIAEHPDFISSVEANNLAEEITVKAVAGTNISWPDQCGAVIPSAKGEVEDGTGGGIPLVITVPKNSGLETYLSIHPDLESILYQSY